MLRELWRAASRPARFFARLGERPADLPRAALAGASSVAVALLVAALALARASASDAYALLIGAVVLAGLFNWLLIAALGGLVIMRPTQLDLRAWEVVLWSWAPAGFVALSLLLAVWLAPLPGLVLGYVGTLAWHLAALSSALAALAPKQRPAALAWYLGVVVLLPWLLFAGLFALVVSSAA